MVIGPGAEPTTRYSKLTMVESAYEVKFYKNDFSNVDRPGVPIVLGHNSNVILSREEYCQWQLELVAKIGKCFLNVVHEVDVSCIKKDHKHHLGVMQSAVSAGVAAITGTHLHPHHLQHQYFLLSSLLWESLVTLLNLLLLLLLLKNKREEIP